MAFLKYGWRLFQQSLHIKIITALLGVSFLVLTFYTASMLSSMPLQDISKKKSLASVPEKAFVRGDFIEVLVTTDKSGITGVIALVNSILRNTKQPVHFYFVTSPDGLTELHSWLEFLKFKKFSYVIKAFDATNYGINSSEIFENDERSLLEFSKIFISELFPQTKGILISLSNDVIVQGDIKELKNITISAGNFAVLSTNCDNVARTYNNKKVKYFHFLDMSKPQIQELHLNGRQCVPDLSVMILNMTLWHDADVTSQLKHWIDLNQKEKLFLKNTALSPLLIVFNNKTSPLEGSWHVRHLGITKGTRYSKEYLENAKLLQWDGHFKPWIHKTAVSSFWMRYALGKPKIISLQSS